MKYEKITRQDVYEVLVSTSLDIMNPIGGIINLVDIAGFLKTSRYQVKKYIDEMKTEGMVELHSVSIPCEDEVYPPYWGYTLTERGKNTDYYKEQDKKHENILKECFGI